MSKLFVWRIGGQKGGQKGGQQDGQQEPLLVGEIEASPIRFRYSPDYLADPAACAISLSLPLQESAFDEATLSPYFNGLLPENETRTAIANALRTTPDDFLTILLSCGREIIGDIAITEDERPCARGSYTLLSAHELQDIFVGLSSLAESNRESRLSLAGSQGKTGLAHMPDTPLHEGWLKPIDGAASTHVLKTSSLDDIPYLEFLCLKAAASLGIRAPEVELFYAGSPIFCIERFDRTARFDDGALHVCRLHQEDLAQAFGIAPSAKYSELEPSTASAIAGLIRSRSSDPIGDLGEFLKVSLFNYLIGNCDNHLKNLSLVYSPSWRSLRLAPAYDIVSTTRYERFSTSMGMSINGKREINEITASDWLAFSDEIGVHPDEVREFSAHLIDNIAPSLSAAAEEHRDMPELDWLASNLCEEMHARWKVLEQVAC